jgi:hypothetical protein
MDDFEKRLEIDLANWLDPVVDAPVPRRRRQSNGLRALTGGLARPLEITVVPEPIAVVAGTGTP